MEIEQENALAADGNGYYKRNYSRIGTIADPVFEQMQILQRINPIKSILEIGCATGFRLEKARLAFGANCAGIDISPMAIAEGIERYPSIDLRAGAAPRDLGYWSGHSFDVILVGHVQYLLPRQDLFALAATVDGLLNTGGHVITMDFIHHIPTSSVYSHDSSLEVYKGNPSAPWTWNPAYFLVSRQIYPQSISMTNQVDPSEWQTVDVVHKLSVHDAYQKVNPAKSIDNCESEFKPL